MKEYIVYTTEGYTLAPKDNVSVENCQVLGIIAAVSKVAAIEKLFAENEWINKSGFTKDNAEARPLLTATIKEDVAEIIEYLWKEEQKHFQECLYPKEHIYRVLKSLKNNVL